MQASAEQVWATAQEQLRSMLNADIYNLWFAPLRACSLYDSSLLLEVGNEFCEVWLKDNYLGLLQEIVQLASGEKLEVRFRVLTPNVAISPQANTSAPSIKPKPVAEAVLDRSTPAPELSFNPKNTFDTFVVGNNNNFS